MDQSIMRGRYEKAVGRESAYEHLQTKALREKAEKAAEELAQEERSRQESEDRSARGRYEVETF